MTKRTNAIYRTLQILTVLLVVVLTMALAPKVLAFARSYGNRSSYCSLSQTLTDLRTMGQRLDWEAEVNDAVVLIREEDGKYELWDSPDGKWWIPAGNRDILGHLQAEQRQGIYGDPPCNRGDVVLDCGAHVGTFARQALRAGASRVVAIEPAPVNLACLRRNLAAEIRDGLVIVVEKGVWHEDDELLMELRPGETAADRVIEGTTEAPSVKVPLVTIDEIVAELGLESVDMIKMDIEGAERNALMGARETLVRFRPKLAISTYHLADDPEVIPRVITEAVPEYEVSCRFCSRSMWEERVVPQIMYFE